MYTLTAKLTAFTLLAGALLAGGNVAHAQGGGYYYQPRSLYVMPPMYAYQPIFSPQPVVVYEPVVTYPAPVAGYVVPTAATVVAPTPVVTPAPVVQYQAPAPATVFQYGAPAPVVAPAPTVTVGVGPGRVVERQFVGPQHSRYRYHVHNAYGPDYTYRVRDNGYAVRFSERWSR